MTLEHGLKKLGTADRIGGCIRARLVALRFSDLPYFCFQLITFDVSRDSGFE